MEKWQSRLPAVVALVGGLLCSSMAAGQSVSPFKGEDGAQPAAWQSFARNADYAGYAAYQDEKKTPFEEEPPSAPVPEDAAAPVPDQPLAPLPPAPLPLAPLPPAEIPGADLPDEYGAAYAGDDGGATCSQATCSGCSRGCRGACGVFARGLRGIEIGGWIDQGITANSRPGADRFNGPVTFNDRYDEWQINQVWVYAEKAADTGGHGWDVGGRVDFIYGTDRRFTQALGLEDRWNQERFYGAALPQAYMDVAVNDLTVRMGHFYTIIGYETVPAPDNFFYSHAYTLQYGEPFTHTGLLATYTLSDQWAISAGCDRGWNNWEDNNRDLAFLGGVSWASYDKATSLTFAISSGAYDDAGEHNRTMYSVVFARQLTNRLQYVLQHDYGIDDDGGSFQVQPDPTLNAEWYGVNQYLLYKLNPRWDLGVRLEWFRDDDGTRVGGIGAPHGWTLGPDRAANQPGWAGDFYELTLGLNWKPRRNLILRPECRWDWYAGPADGAGRLPYNFGNSADQLTFAADLIITF